MNKRLFFIISILLFIITSCSKEDVEKKVIEKEVSLSNNRTYEWYMDQKETGQFNNVNCGPTATTMTIKWADATCTLSPEMGRQKYRSEGGWWYTTDIIDYLDDNNIPNHLIALPKSILRTSDAIIEELKLENIVILCVDMYYIRFESDKTKRVDKFYKTSTKDWGHFLVVKGYKIEGGETYFEVYDPNSWGSKYADTTLKGKDRFYRDEDIFKATNIWWQYAIVISEKDAPAASQRSSSPAYKSSTYKYIDKNSIVHQKGR
jgi:hypothetical protein